MVLMNAPLFSQYHPIFFYNLANVDHLVLLDTFAKFFHPLANYIFPYGHSLHL